MNVNDLVKITNKVDELRTLVHINNDKADRDLTDAYNQGVDAMSAQLKYYLNDLALKCAFGGGQ